MISYIGIVTLSYVLGGIPTGYLVGKMHGIDIREYGSGNPGTANVYRTLGAKAGIITFITDFFKGLGPVLLAVNLFPGNYTVIILCGAAAIAGHIWTIFLNFKGGKGVATSAGVFTAILPLPVLGAFIVFVIAVSATKHISIGSMAASITLPILSFYLKMSSPYSIMALIVCALILHTHIPNIRRILKGQELSYKHKKTKPAEGS